VKVRKELSNRASEISKILIDPDCTLSVPDEQLLHDIFVSLKRFINPVVDDVEVLKSEDSIRNLAEGIIEELKDLMRWRADALNLPCTQEAIEKIIKEHIKSNTKNYKI